MDSARQINLSTNTKGTLEQGQANELKLMSSNKLILFLSFPNSLWHIIGNAYSCGSEPDLQHSSGGARGLTVSWSHMCAWSKKADLITEYLPSSGWESHITWANQFYLVLKTQSHRTNCDHQRLMNWIYQNHAQTREVEGSLWLKFGIVEAMIASLGRMRSTTRSAPLHLLKPAPQLFAFGHPQLVLRLMRYAQ